VSQLIAVSSRKQQLLYAYTPLYKAMRQADLWVIVSHGKRITHNDSHKLSKVHRARFVGHVGHCGSTFKSQRCERITRALV